MAKKVEEVRDGFLGDLPEDLRIKIMNLHKVIVDKVRTEMKRPKYASIANSTWAKGWLEEFLAEPTDKNHIGSVRVYRKGKRYSCMIQVTGHVSNLRNTEDEDLFHALIRNAFTAIRPIARRKFDLTLTCESEHGEPFEGYDVWTKQKVAASIWENWKDKKTKDIKPFKESNDSEGKDILVAEMSELPEGLQYLLMETSYDLFGSIDEQCGYTELVYENGEYSGSIFLGDIITEAGDDFESYSEEFENRNPGKFLIYNEETNSIEVGLESMYVEKLMDAIEEYCSGECRRLANGKIEVSPELLRQFRREANVHDEQDDNRCIIAMNAKNTTTDPGVIRKGYRITPEEKEKMIERERERREKENPRSAFDNFELITNNKRADPDNKPGYHHFHREEVEYNESVSTDTIRNVANRLQKEFNCEILFTDSMNMYIQGTGGAFMIESDRDSINKIVNDKMDSNFRAKSPLAGDKGKFEKVIIVDPSVLSQFNLETEEDVEVVLKHEYGHVKTYHQISDDEWLDYTFIRMTIGGLTEAYAYEKNVNTKDILTEINYFYHKLKPEALANNTMGLDPKKIVKILFGKTPTGKGVNGLNLNALLSFQLSTAERNLIRKSLAGTIEQNKDDIIAISNATKEFCKKVITDQKFLKEMNDGIDEGINDYLNESVITEGSFFDKIKAGASKLAAKAKGLLMKKSLGNLQRLDLPSNANRRVPLTLFGTNIPIKVKTAMAESFTEAADVDKSVLSSMAKNIMSGTKTYTQKDTDILSSVLTTKYLGQWSKYHKKLEIKLSNKMKSGVVEFVLPKMSPDFVSNLLVGKTSIMELVNKNDTITIKMNEVTFKTMKQPNDLYRFFRNAVNYYTRGISKYNKSLCHSLMNMNKRTQLALSKTNLYSIVVASVQMLFVFDDIDMSNPKAFTVNMEDLNTLESFLNNITSRYKSPKDEQKSIINDLNKMIQSFRESFDDIQFGMVANEVAKYYEGSYDRNIQTLMEQFKADQIDMEWFRETTDPQIKYYQEKFGVKKLKKIPKDTVAYITIETESIRDANDKMMIASYCLDKIEIVEWYIELIDAKSTKYIVPHSRPYLESMRTQLLACYKKIMDTPIPKADRPIIDIKYPKGYEG